jgi:lysophospholipase L1-like esterase
MCPRRKCIVLAAASVLCLGSAALAAKDNPIKVRRGERILFLGDSITQAGVSKTGYITLIKKVLDSKYAEVEITDVGISGNKVPDLQRRVDKEVVARKPTIVFIYIGINDVRHAQNNPKRGASKDKFASGLRQVIGKITKAGARVILCTPTVIGEKHDGSNRNDKKLDEYADISRRLAKELTLPLCDLRKAFIDYLKEHNPKNAAQGVLTTDTVHLNAAGEKLMARTMLKMLGE